MHKNFTNGNFAIAHQHSTTLIYDRCGSLATPPDHHPPPPRLSVPLLDALRTPAGDGETVLPVDSGKMPRGSALNDATDVSIAEKPGSRRVSQPSAVTSETAVSEVQSKESRKMPRTSAGTEETAYPAQKAVLVGHKIAAHAAREEECEEMIEGTPEKKKQAGVIT